MQASKPERARPADVSAHTEEQGPDEDKASDHAGPERVSVVAVASKSPPPPAARQAAPKDPALLADPTLVTFRPL